MMAVIPLLLAIGAVPVLAGPVSYTIDFSVLSCEPTPPCPIAAPTGSFVFDASNTGAPFTDFTVSWDGYTFDLTSSANNSNAEDIGIIPSCAGGPDVTAGVNGFLYLTACPAQSFWAAQSVPGGSTGFTSQGAFYFYGASAFDPGFFGGPDLGTGGTFYGALAFVDPAPTVMLGGGEVAVAATTVPEPGTVVLTLCGLCVGGFLIRRNGSLNS
jgi:hypothetical protein